MASALTYALISISFFAVSGTLEWLASRWRNVETFDRKSTRASFGIYIGHMLIQSFWTTLVVVPIFHLAHSLSPLRIGPTFNDPAAKFFSLTLLAMILIDDLVYYFHHRINHAVPFFWAIHQTHHSSNVYNVFVACRISWFDINTLVFWLPLTLVGFDPDVVIAIHYINLLINTVLHTKLIGKLGPLEHIFMTPSNHRVHHAVNEPYQGRNLGGAFIFWDKIFGTYVPETEPVIFESTPELQSESIRSIATYGVRSVWRKVESK